MARLDLFQATRQYAKKHPPTAPKGTATVSQRGGKRMTQGKKNKAHSLTGRITLPLMCEAFTAVKRNRGAAGIDKVSIKMFEANFLDNIQALMRDLKTGCFQPQALRRVYIPKDQTSKRPLGIPAVRDRIAQEVVRRLLNPIFEPLFHDASYGFRAGRNCHMALKAVLEAHAQGPKVVLDADIKGFFDNLPHPVDHAGCGPRSGRRQHLEINREISRLGTDGRRSLQANHHWYSTRRSHFASVGQYRPQSSGLAAPPTRLSLRALCR